MSKVKALLRSRRFWAAAVGLGAVVLGDLAGIELDTEQLVAIATMVSAWILGDTVRPTE